MPKNTIFYNMDTYNEPITSVVPFKLLVAPSKGNELQLQVVKIRTLVNDEVIIDIDPKTNPTLLATQEVKDLDKQLVTYNHETQTYQTEAEHHLQLPTLQGVNHYYIQKVENYLKSNTPTILKPQPTKNYMKPVYHNKYALDLAYLTLDATFSEQALQSIMEYPTSHRESDIDDSLAIKYQQHTFTNYTGKQELFSTFNIITKGNVVMKVTIKTSSLESYLLVTNYSEDKPQFAMLPLRDRVISGRYYTPRPLSVSDNFRDQVVDSVMSLPKQEKYTNCKKVS